MLTQAYLISSLAEDIVNNNIYYMVCYFDDNVVRISRSVFKIPKNSYHFILFNNFERIFLHFAIKR